jgi:hypothetical protein
VPRHLWHAFWNESPEALRLPEDAEHVATRLVLSRDPGAIAWALGNLPAPALRHAAANRGADAKTRSMVRNALAAR